MNNIKEIVRDNRKKENNSMWLLDKEGWYKKTVIYSLYIVRQFKDTFRKLDNMNIKQ